MKKISKLLLFASLVFGAAAAGAVFTTQKVSEVEAASTTNYPRNGQSGNILYVNGAGTYFKQGEAKLAIRCWDNSESAWSEAVDYRCYNDLLRVMIPYKDGRSKTWSYYVVCRYDPNKDPQVSGYDGVYNQTQDLSFGNMIQAQNVVNITGYGDYGRLNYNYSTADYYGIQGQDHVYLDLSQFTDWEQADAKFAIWFGAPHYTNEGRWGQASSTGGNYSSFCWKVNGQDNDHLYECVVPTLNESANTIWNMVKVIRVNPICSEPNWDNTWNATQDLHFNPTNHTATMIRVTGWDNSAELDVENSISRATRMEFFGRYFLNIVQCSGTGNSDATTSNMWDAVKYEYETHLSKLFQGEFWKAVADEEGTLMQQAAARYDYIVFYKQYNHADFVNRAESPNRSFNIPANTVEENNVLPIVLIIVASSISLLSVTLIVLIKIKRRNY